MIPEPQLLSRLGYPHSFRQFQRFLFVLVCIAITARFLARLGLFHFNTSVKFNSLNSVSVTTGQDQSERADGEVIWVRNLISPVWENGEVVELKGVTLDITKQRKLTEQLNQSQKLEAIGQLAAGIAHEINTPSQFVSDNIKFFKSSFNDLHALYKDHETLLTVVEESHQFKTDAEKIRAFAKQIDAEYLFEEIPNAIEQLIDGIARVSNIVRAMKEFSHPGSAEKVSTELNRAIQNTITIAQNEWKYVATIQTIFDPDLPSVKVLLGEFNQVILNMIVNAAHAIAEYQRKRNDDSKGAIVISTCVSGDNVEIRLSDTGCIAKEHQKKIFNPFFTTKEVGKDAGQGLAIAYSVITERHQGSIDVESEPGKGTAFIIRIPLSDNKKSTENEQPVLRRQVS